MGMNDNEPQRTQRARRIARADLDRTSGQVVDSAMRVHRALGPGLLESAYLACLLHELIERGLEVRSQVTLPILYDGVRIEAGYRVDLLVEGTVMVELKAITAIQPIHRAQLLSYLKLGHCRLGLLINFHVALLRDGIERLVNDF